MAAGPDIAAFRGPAGTLNLPQILAHKFEPWAINSQGLIVGAATPLDNSSRPFAAVLFAQPNPVLENLDPVFGWTEGVATSINDARQIAGYSDGIRPIDILPGNHPLNFVYLLNGATVLGADAQGSLAYTPASGIVYLKDPAGNPVRLTRAAFNNAGVVLLTAPSIGRIYAPGMGAADQPPAPGFTVHAFNVQGQFVGLLGSEPSLYTAAGGVVPLATLIPSGSGWTLSDATAINDIGAILVTGTKNGRTTSLQLTPGTP